MTPSLGCHINARSIEGPISACSGNRVWALIHRSGMASPNLTHGQGVAHLTRPEKSYRKIVRFMSEEARMLR